MSAREPSYGCGRIRPRCSGAPVRISVCHCLECRKRARSAFGAQARFLKANVETWGEPSAFARRGGDGSIATFRFCANCGSTVWRKADSDEERIAVAIGAFANPAFPQPRFSVSDGRKRARVAFDERLPIEHER